MLTGVKCLLVTCLVTITSAIRVDWNTNTGPIIPPTPRTTVRPVPPFREPAPVWEDLSNDIPNPNPYIYVPPPPSRPKQRLNTNVNYSPNNQNRNINYGTLITTSNVNSYHQQSQHVAALSPQYIPNVGFRYVAVIPSVTTTSKYPGALSPNDISDGYKLQGKYNAKTKKYKAYEKVKYVPHNYYPKDNDRQVENSSKRNVPETIPIWFDDNVEELPQTEEKALKFNTLHERPSSNTVSNSPNDIDDTKNTTTATTHSQESTASLSSSSPKPFKFYSKYVYVKDSLSKSKLNKKS